MVMFRSDNRTRDVYQDRKGLVCKWNGSISTSGVSIIGLMGSVLSIIRLYNSAASCGACHLICKQDGEWAVAAVYSHGVAAGSAVPD